MCPLSLLIISADIPQANLPSDESDRQRALLKLFFADVTPEGRAFLTEYFNDDPDDYLRWVGVVLTDGVVVTVRCDEKSWIGHFNIHALPNSTKRIVITNCGQKCSLQTRMLPKSLGTLMIYKNEIFGTIDLTSLPDGLRQLSAFGNNICGPVDLTKLPRSLQEISLATNQIDQEVVLYANLPPEIYCISFSDQRDVKHGVKAARPLRSEDKLSNETARGIFGGLRHYDPWPEE